MKIKMDAKTKIKIIIISISFCIAICWIAAIFSRLIDHVKANEEKIKIHNLQMLHEIDSTAAACENKLILMQQRLKEDRKKDSIFITGLHEERNGKMYPIKYPKKSK